MHAVAVKLAPEARKKLAPAEGRGFGEGKPLEVASSDVLHFKFSDAETSDDAISNFFPLQYRITMDFDFLRLNSRESGFRKFARPIGPTPEQCRACAEASGNGADSSRADPF